MSTVEHPRPDDAAQTTWKGAQTTALGNGQLVNRQTLRAMAEGLLVRASHWLCRLEEDANLDNASMGEQAALLTAATGALHEWREIQRELGEL